MVNEGVFVLHLAIFIQQRAFVLFQMLQKMHIKGLVYFQIWMQNVHHSCVKVGLQYLTMLYKLVVLETKHAESAIKIVVFRRREVGGFMF